jgi:hypothetical protein
MLRMSADTIQICIGYMRYGVRSAGVFRMTIVIQIHAAGKIVDDHILKEGTKFCVLCRKSLARPPRKGGLPWHSNHPHN